LGCIFPKRKKAALRLLLKIWSGKGDSNSRPQPWQGSKPEYTCINDKYLPMPIYAIPPINPVIYRMYQNSI
jgi:hypothetical protein